MKLSVHWIFGIIVAAVAVAANPNGPLGGFWRPFPGAVTLNDPLFPYFLQLGILEAIALGVAVTLLVSTYPAKAIRPLTLGETRRGFLALVWSLGSWWVHDSLHLHFGAAHLPLLFVEYGFHATVIVAVLYLIFLAGKLYRAAK